MLFGHTSQLLEAHFSCIFITFLMKDSVSLSCREAKSQIMVLAEKEKLVAFQKTTHRPCGPLDLASHVIIVLHDTLTAQSASSLKAGPSMLCSFQGGALRLEWAALTWRECGEVTGRLPASASCHVLPLRPPPQVLLRLHL